MNELESLGLNKVSRFIEFYREYNPVDCPMTDSYVSLCSIENIATENTKGEPGIYLSKIGLIVFAVTVGGNPICIDCNNVIDGDASVYIADSNFCAYNDDLEMVEIVWPSEELIEIVGDNDEPIELTYENALLCMKKVEDSFICFLEKLSRNEYEDLEELLED